MTGPVKDRHGHDIPPFALVVVEGLIGRVWMCLGGDRPVLVVMFDDVFLTKNVYADDVELLDTVCGTRIATGIVGFDMPSYKICNQPRGHGGPCGYVRGGT